MILAPLLAQTTWLDTWITPLWIISVGVLLGILILTLLLGLCWAIGRTGLLKRVTGHRGWLLILAAVIAVPLTWYLNRLLITYGSQAPSVAMSPYWLTCFAVLVFGCLYGLLSLLSPRNSSEIPLMLHEGVLWPLTWILLGTASFALLGWFAVREPVEILRSLERLAHTGVRTYQFSIPPSPDTAQSGLPEEVPIPVGFNGDECYSIVFDSDQRLGIEAQPGSTSPRPLFSVDAGERKVWLKREGRSDPFRGMQVKQLYVRNYGVDEAKLQLMVGTSPNFPQAAAIPVTAIGVVVLFLLYMALRLAMPRTAAIALATYKSEIAQPLFAIILSFGIVALIAFHFIPYNTFGEDIKILKTSGITLIMVLGIVQAIWAASTSIADEIDGRTALTVLSKPLTRRNFIIGKFLGISWTVLLLFVILGLVLVITVAYKPIHEARESTNEDPTWQVCHHEVVRMTPGIVLAYLETLVLTAISVAISTRLGMLANFTIMFVVYLLGHLAPLLVMSSEEGFPVVHFFGNLIALIFPNLDHFRIEAAISGDKTVPLDYMGATFVYGAIYTLIALLLALLLFEDRDLT